MEEFATTFVAHAGEPLKAFFHNANMRHFWLYTAAGMLIAVIAHRASGEKTAFAASFFARDVWLSRSAMNDYGILVINPMILAMALSWLVAHFHMVQGAVIGALHALGVQGEATGGDALIAGAALTVSLYLVNDFMRWFIHYLQHRIPVLWELHKVHHSAEHLNFATAERHHPLDLLFVSMMMTMAMAAVNGVFIAVYGDVLTVAAVGGANVLWVASNLIGGVLRHSPAWVSYGRRVERWLISPAMHQIHHSDAPRHFDKNFGGTLAVWDRWFGTLYIPEGRERLSFGLGAEQSEYRSLFALYWTPLRRSAERLLRKG